MRAMLLTGMSLLENTGKNSSRDKASAVKHGATIEGPLVFKELPIPQPGPNDILIKISVKNISGVIMKKQIVFRGL